MASKLLPFFLANGHQRAKGRAGRKASKTPLMPERGPLRLPPFSGWGFLLGLAPCQSCEIGRLKSLPLARRPVSTPQPHSPAQAFVI